MTVSAVLLLTEPVAFSEPAAHYSAPNWHTHDRPLCVCVCVKPDSDMFYFEDLLEVATENS